MNKKMRVIFCGTPQIGADLLEALVKMNDVEIVAVISQPDRPSGRQQVLNPTSVKKCAQKYRLTCFQPVKIGELYEQLRILDFDFLITCAYGQFVPTKILDLAKCEALNVHGSLLPLYRGGAPIQRAIIDGETVTGVSLLRMVRAMDAGPVFATLSTPIAPTDDSGSLFAKISQLGQKILVENLAKIYQGDLQPIEQDPTKVTFAPTIKSVEEQINWSTSAREIVNLIRGLAPTPIAYTLLNNERYKVKRARVVKNEEIYFNQVNNQPGRVLAIDQEGILVQTGEGIVKILEIQRPGKKMLPANLYFTNNLRDINVGANFDIMGGTK